MARGATARRRTAAYGAGGYLIALAVLLGLPACKTSGSRLKVTGGERTSTAPTGREGSVVMLRWTGRGGGAAFASGVLCKGNLILTNAHVINGLKDRVGGIEVYSGNYQLLNQDRVAGFESVIPDRYVRGPTPTRSTAYDYGLLRVLGDGAVRSDLPLAYAEFAPQGPKAGDLINYIGYGENDSGVRMIRHKATAVVDALVGDNHLVITGLPSGLAIDGAAVKCLDALCLRVNREPAIDPVKIKSGDSGGGGLDAYGRVMALMAASTDDNLNISINLRDKEVSSWLEPKLRAAGYDDFRAGDYDELGNPRPSADTRPAADRPGDQIELHPHEVIDMDTGAKLFMDLSSPDLSMLQDAIFDLVGEVYPRSGLAPQAADHVDTGGADSPDSAAPSGGDEAKGSASGDDARGRGGR